MFGFFESHLGELAGLATAVLWTVTALLFAAAGRRMGVTVVNTVRILLAIVLLAATHRALTGAWIPDAHPRQVVYLAFSGVVGLAIGDQALFRSFVDIGPRLSTLVMTTSPLFAAVFGWVVLGESLSAFGWIGMALTLGGVAWVVFERSSVPLSGDSRLFARGIGLALFGSACQAGGLLLSKQGIGHGWLSQEEFVAPQTATLIRMVFAGMGMIPFMIVYALRERRRRVAGVAPKLAGSARAGYTFALIGAVTGPFLGVWMSLVAADRVPLGVAQTLCSTVPVFMIPAVALIHGERVSLRAAVGAVIAVAGSALLFVRPA